MINALIIILLVVDGYSALDYMFGKREDEARNKKMMVIASLLILLALAVKKVYFT